MKVIVESKVVMLPALDKYENPQKVGEILRSKRESLGLSYEDVVLKIKIRRCFLEALEDSRFDDLPGSVFAMGFIRNYADFLGLSPQTMLGYYALETQNSTPPSNVYKMYLPPQKREFINLKMIFISLGILSLVLYGWYRIRSFDEKSIVKTDRLSDLLGENLNNKSLQENHNLSDEEILEDDSLFLMDQDDDDQESSDSETL